MSHETPTQLSQGLDYYKATMGQVEYLKYRDTEVTFELKNRGENLLSEYIDPTELSERLDCYREGWQPHELAYLAGLQNQDGSAQFSEDYLDFLADNPLPPIDISRDERGDIAASTTGPWPLVSLWETVVMSELNELYFEKKLATEGKDINDIYAEGDRRLDAKVKLLKTRPDIKFADFGTRRRFSYSWHKHVIERLAHELPDNFAGTSNVYLAHKLDVKPIGTFAHEMPMVYAAMADRDGDDPLSSHGKMLDDWNDVYRGDLSTALTDTFTSDFFFADMTDKQAEQWQSLRHDSGDPIEFGEKVIQFYVRHNIDPMSKSICFSDGLDINEIVRLASHFEGRVGIVFGWGTTLTNDLGLKSNNIVMKAVAVEGQSTVKLSDSKGKYTGDMETITKYKKLVGEQIARAALKDSIMA